MENSAARVKSYPGSWSSHATVPSPQRNKAELIVLARPMLFNEQTCRPAQLNAHPQTRRSELLREPASSAFPSSTAQCLQTPARGQAKKGGLRPAAEASPTGQEPRCSQTTLPEGNVSADRCSRTESRALLNSHWVGQEFWESHAVTPLTSTQPKSLPPGVHPHPGTMAPLSAESKPVASPMEGSPQGLAVDPSDHAAKSHHERHRVGQSSHRSQDPPNHFLPRTPGEALSTFNLNTSVTPRSTQPASEYPAGKANSGQWRLARPELRKTEGGINATRALLRAEPRGGYSPCSPRAPVRGGQKGPSQREPLRIGRRRPSSTRSSPSLKTCRQGGAGRLGLSGCARGRQVSVPRPPARPGTHKGQPPPEPANIKRGSGPGKGLGSRSPGFNPRPVGSQRALAPLARQN